MVCVIYLESFEFKPARRVVFHMSLLGIFFLSCAFLNHSAINHPMALRVVCFLLLWTVILNWRSNMTEFVSWRLCLVVFKMFSDRSGIRTRAHTYVPEVSVEEILRSGASDRWIFPAWGSSAIMLLNCAISFFNRGLIGCTVIVIHSEKVAGTDLRLNPHVF